MDDQKAVTPTRKREVAGYHRTRRQNEVVLFQDMMDNLPIPKCNRDKASQMSLLRAAISFVKIRGMMSNSKFKASTSLVDDFQGFLMIVDLEGTILYVTKNVTEQAGPLSVDVIGQTVRDLLHPDDEELVSRFLDVNNLGKQGIFVVRMKCTLAATVRSQEKVEYKTVFLSCHLKTFNLSSSNNTRLKTVAAVMLCRTEYHITFPEIVMGSCFDFQICEDARHILSGDPKMPWLVGYHEEDLSGQSVFVCEHPKDVLNSMFVHRTLKSKLQSDGMVMVPHTRIMSAWGQWLWVCVQIAPAKIRSKKKRSLVAQIAILGPDTSEYSTPVHMSSRDVQPTRMSDDVDELIESILGPVDDPLSFQSGQYPTQTMPLSSDQNDLQWHNSSSSTVEGSSVGSLPGFLDVEPHGYCDDGVGTFLSSPLMSMFSQESPTGYSISSDFPSDEMSN